MILVDGINKSRLGESEREKENYSEPQKNKNQQTIDKLNNEIKKMNEEIETLEKDYISKITRLLIMTQIHCEIKTEIYDDFNKCGVGKNLNEINANNQSFNNGNPSLYN